MSNDEADKKAAPARRSAAHVPPMSLIKDAKFHNDEDETDEAALRKRALEQAATIESRMSSYDEYS